MTKDEQYMAFMVVRVELHENSPTDKPSGADYDKLHDKMEKAGFSRTINVNSALPSSIVLGEYDLPHATYASNKFATANEALRNAWAAADGGGYKYGVVASGGDFDCYGLKLVTKKA